MDTALNDTGPYLAFLTLGVLGKRFALIARRTKAVTITDFLRARYNSDYVVIAASIALLVFFMASMLAQFIGRQGSLSR